MVIYMTNIRCNALKRLMWRRKSGTVLVMAAAVLVSTEVDARQLIAKCLNQAHEVNYEIINCSLTETIRQDAQLNDQYKKLMTKLSEEGSKALIEAQRAWIRFRDTN